MVETLITIELFQTTPVLDDALGLRWMECQQPQLGFEEVQQSQRPENRFSERVPRLRCPLAIEMPTASDASFCHFFPLIFSPASLCRRGASNPWIPLCVVRTFRTC